MAIHIISIIVLFCAFIVLTLSVGTVYKKEPQKTDAEKPKNEPKVMSAQKNVQTEQSPVRMAPNVKALEETQFEIAVKNRVQKLLKKYCNATVIWTESSRSSIQQKRTFRQYMTTQSGENVLFEVVMGKEGAARINFPNSGHQSIPTTKKELQKFDAQRGDGRFEKTRHYKKEVSEKKHPPTQNPPILAPPQKPVKSNTRINKDGKEEVLPDFNTMASDWINDNLSYLNNICNDAFIQSSGGRVEALIDKSHLPNDKESWDAIGKALLEQGEIDQFKVCPDGINIAID